MVGNLFVHRMEMFVLPTEDLSKGHNWTRPSGIDVGGMVDYRPGSLVADKPTSHNKLPMESVYIILAIRLPSQRFRDRSSILISFYTTMSFVWLQLQVLSGSWYGKGNQIAN